MVFIFSVTVRLWLCMFIGWGGRLEASHQSFGSRAWTTRGKSLFCGNTNKVKASCVSQTVLGKEALSVGWRGDVRRSLSKLLEVWFSQQVIFKIDSVLMVWVYAITMIGPLQCERAGQENMKGLVLPEIPAKTVLCPLVATMSYRWFYRKIQRDKGRKHFGFGHGVFKPGQNNLNTTEWAGAQDLQQRISAALNCTCFSRSAEEWKGSFLWPA